MTKVSTTQKENHTRKCDVKRNGIINLTEDERLKRSNKLWGKLVKELDVLQDNNYTARKLFDYVERHYS